MSIIYEALKKAEKNIRAMPSPQTADRKKDSSSKLKIYLLYLLIVCIGLFAANAVFGLMGNPKTPRVAKARLPTSVILAGKELSLIPLPPAATSAQQTAPTDESTGGALVLNGVFFSEGEGYALINNKIVKLGDEVNGALVKKISLEEVELEVADKAGLKKSFFLSRH